MRLPDLEDGLLTAANVLEVDREKVDGFVDVARLHLALLAPTAHVAGAPVYRSLAEVVARVFVECALGEIVGRRAVRFGWLMAQHTIELNGYRWRRHEEDRAQLLRFEQQLRAGLDPGRALARWMDERIVRERQSASRMAAQLPRPLHVSSPMTGLDNDERATMSAWATAVDDGLSEFLLDRGAPDEATTIRPQVFSAFGETEEELNAVISRRVREADGIVVLAYKGSWGACSELETALAGHIPVLYLHPKELELSPRVAGRLREAGATCLSFEASSACPATEQIAALVRGWLRSHYAAILDTARRRHMLETRLVPFVEAVNTAQTRLGPHEWRAALAAVGLTESRCKALTGEGSQLQFASVADFLLLATAHGVRADIDAVEVKPPSDRPSELTEAELAFFAEVVRIDRIPALEVMQMTLAAQREVAQPGRRRKTFADHPSWRQLRRRLHSAS